jgi:hypothetical protein
MEQDILQSRVQDQGKGAVAHRSQPAMASPEERQKLKKSNPMIYGHYPLSGKESLKTAHPGNYRLNQLQGTSARINPAFTKSPLKFINY